ncbi:MAG: DUF1993 domain-containing protein [Myxococcota bacterium]
MPLFDAVIPGTTKILTNMEGWLGKATAFAESRDFSPDRFLSFRLAPGMFAFDRNVQAACDTAKFAAARVTGKDAPSYPDEESTMVELVERIQKTRTYLEGFTPADFEGADSRVVPLPFAKGKGAVAGEYLNGFALPNFFFHATTVYAILRHGGVELGKRDYLGSLDMVDL